MLGADHKGARDELEVYCTPVISFYKDAGLFVETPRCDVTPYELSLRRDTGLEVWVGGEQLCIQASGTWRVLPPVHAASVSLFFADLTSSWEQ